MTNPFLLPRPHHIRHPQNPSETLKNLYSTPPIDRRRRKNLYQSPSREGGSHDSKTKKNASGLSTITGKRVVPSDSGSVDESNSNLSTTYAGNHVGGYISSVSA